MAISSSLQMPAAQALPSRGRAARAQWLLRTGAVKWPIRYVFYAFVVSLPFEESGLAIGVTLPKLFGILLVGTCFLQPRKCFQWPPKALWIFVVYLFAFVLAAVYLILTPPTEPELVSSVRTSLFRLVQLLILFWISFNLMKHEGIARGALWTLVAANLVLAGFQLLGVSSNVSEEGRVTAFEQNPNGVATVLSLGLLALFGLAYGADRSDWKSRLLFWLSSGVFAVPIVQTGSRGAAVALALGLSIFFLRGKNLATKLKFGLIGLCGIVVLAAASYSIEAVRVRWEETIYDQDVAGRDRIYSEAVAMILERPFIGWGPVNHLWQLGGRLGLPSRDEHNVYLWLLAEVGVLGAIPFFAALGLCLRAAWAARRSALGILPLVMLLFILVSSLKATLLNRKYYWLVLAFAAAAASYPVARRTVPAAIAGRRFSGLHPVP